MDFQTDTVLSILFPDALYTCNQDGNSFISTKGFIFLWSLGMADDTKVESEIQTKDVTRALIDFLGGIHREWEVITVSRVEDITSGWETQLFFFDLGYVKSGKNVCSRRVVRVYFGGNASRKVLKEFNIMGSLRSLGYPVPEVYEVETGDTFLGRPFLVMERVEGQDMLPEFLRTWKEDPGGVLDPMMKLVVDLHSLDASRVFPLIHGKVDTPRYIEGVLGGARRKAMNEGGHWLNPIINWLEEGSTNVSFSEPAVIHKDFHPGNIMIRGDGSPAVIDWGASTLGDPRDDLAWSMLLAGSFIAPSLRGLILESYERISGGEITDIEYFEVLSALRRLVDFHVTFTSGAEGMGMRPGAAKMMRETSSHLHWVFEVVNSRTGITLPGIDELLGKI